MKQLLVGTTNNEKVETVAEITKDAGVHLLTLKDIQNVPIVDESGNSPEENAKLKVTTYYNASKIPALSIDSGLYIDAFPEDKQPGMHVRRVCGPGEVTDEEMLAWYQHELDQVGGSAPGRWITAVALQTQDKVFAATFSRETRLTSKASGIINHGAPLNSLQIDPLTGKYIADLTPEERVLAYGNVAAGIAQFIRDHLGDL